MRRYEDEGVGGRWNGRGQSTMASRATSVGPKSLKNQSAAVMDGHGTPRISKPSIHLKKCLNTDVVGRVVHTHTHTQRCWQAKIHEFKTAEGDTHAEGPAGRNRFM